MRIEFLFVLLAYFASMVHGMQMFFKTLTVKHINLEAENANTVGTIKTKIQEKEGIPRAQQSLVFDEKQLLEDDEKHRADYKIQKESRLQLPLPSSHLQGGQNKKMLISIMYDECILSDCIRRQLDLDVYDWEQIIDVKEKIRLRHGIPLREQRLNLLHFNRELADESSLEAAGCRDRSKIALVVRGEQNANANANIHKGCEGKMLIRVDYQQGPFHNSEHDDVLVLDVYSWESIDDVKEKLALRIGKSPQKQKLYKSFTYGQQLMNGQDTLANCGIGHKRLLILVIEKVPS